MNLKEIAAAALDACGMSFMADATDETLAEHDNRFHGGKYDPKTMTCELRERRAALDPIDADIKPSGIGGIYTGGAADYNRPSLMYIGSGEGTQVYGWGLYGSNRRGVANKYSRIAQLNRIGGTSHRLEELDGGDTDGKVVNKWYDKAKKLAATYISNNGGDKGKALKKISSVVKALENKYPNGSADKEMKNAMYVARLTKNIIESDGQDQTGPKNHGVVYEQTFFTNRDVGDESHLLKWYEPLSKENAMRVVDGLKKRGWKVHHDKMDRDSWKCSFWDKTGNDLFVVGQDTTGESLYYYLSAALGSPKEASAFLVDSDIDGIKYPVNSYGGKKIKDGNKVGWNYVSFRDDNIRVDKKYVAGKEVAAKDESPKGPSRKHPDGTPCRAESPDSCPIERKKSKADDLQDSRNVTYTFKVGGVNSYEETMDTTATSLSEALRNVRYRGANGIPKFTSWVWVKLLALDGHRLRVCATIMGDEKATSQRVKQIDADLRAHLFGKGTDRASVPENKDAGSGSGNNGGGGDGVDSVPSQDVAPFTSHGQRHADTLRVGQGGGRDLVGGETEDDSAVPVEDGKRLHIGSLLKFLAKV